MTALLLVYEMAKHAVAFVVVGAIVAACWLLFYGLLRLAALIS